MAHQDNRSLLDLLQEVASLPEYMHRDAVKNIVAEWRRKSPLVDEVVSGHTSFEKAIAALIEENSNLRFMSYQKGVCNSPQFEALAEEARARFAGILPLSSMKLIPRAGVAVYDLTTSINLPHSMWSELKSIFGLILLEALLIWGGIGYFVDKKFLAYWPWVIIGSLGLGLFLASCRLIIGYPSYLSERRRLAKNTFAKARFLDKMLHGA